VIVIGSSLNATKFTATDTVKNTPPRPTCGPVGMPALTEASSVRPMAADSESATRWP
jgi:hypothetical protein